AGDAGRGGRGHGAQQGRSPQTPPATLPIRRGGAVGGWRTVVRGARGWHHLSSVRRAGLPWVVLLLLACGTGQVSAPGGGSGSPPGTNRAPVIQVGPSSTSSTIQSGQATQLSVTADDPDGDTLGYAWTQLSPATPQGTFSARTQRNPTWTAPVLTTNATVVLPPTIVHHP